MADADADSPTGPPLVQNWYRPWWKWAIMLVGAFFGAPPAGETGLLLSLAAIVFGAAIWVFVGTVAVRAVKRMRAGMRVTPDAQAD
jgi:hypothetical protein